jgi:hypothetical protein
MDLLKSTFYCGTSIGEIDGDCVDAIPCPSGDNCSEGYGCFAFIQCGGVDIDSLVDTFGDTDRRPSFHLSKFAMSRTILA